MTWKASQRVWLPPVAGPWCYVIAGTGYIKSANYESLVRDKGCGSNLFMEVVTYKTVQGHQLRMTPATATIFFPLCAKPPSSEEGHGGVCDDQAARRTTWYHELQPADLIVNYDIRTGCGGMCDLGAGDFHEPSLPGDIIGTEEG